MGGVGGHMSHLYENPELTFKEMKDVFAMASNGELEGTEKTDGQNLFISYSVQTGRAKAARNKGNIKSGGMTAEELAQKFAGRGALESAFVESFKTFEKAVQSLDPEKQMAIFGPDANIYYNAEIQDPRTANVINYDTKTLNIHQVGHAEFDKETGTIKDIDISRNVRALDKALQNMQVAIEQEEYNVQRNAIKRLRALDDDAALNAAVERLENEINKYGISDKQTIADYQVAKIAPFVEKQVELPEKNKKLLLKRIFGVKGITFNHVVKELDKESKEIVRSIVHSSKDLLKQSILPIESIVHDFSVEMLKGLHSAFILDNPKEVMRLRATVAQAIKGIEASGDENAMNILQQQMQKLKNIEQISTAVEGFVFDYDGKSYKFTGHFAPVNQILGLFRYGRGSSPPLQALGEEDVNTDLLEPNTDLCAKKVAIIPGAFKPPHRGHYDMVEHYSGIVGETGQVFILISPLAASERRGFEPGTQAEVSVEQSVRLWEIYTDQLPNVVVEVSIMRSPVRAAYEFVDENGPLDGGECVILGTSTKGGDQSRFARDVQSYAKEGVKVLNPMEYAFDPKEQLNATDMRKAAKKQNIDALLSFLPQHALKYQDEIVRLFGISEGGPAEMFQEAKKKEADLSAILCGIVEEVLEEDFQSKMKRRLKKSHKAYLDHGPQSPGSAFPSKRPTTKSNAFLAKEVEASEEESIEEVFSLFQSGLGDPQTARAFLDEVAKKLKKELKKAGQGVKQEFEETKTALKLVYKGLDIRGGGPGDFSNLSGAEKDYIQNQLKDVFKLGVVGGIEVLIPGGTAINLGLNKLFKKFGIETSPSAFVSNDKEELEEMSSMAGGNVQGAMMGRGAGKATSPFEDLDVEKENEDERKRSHTIKGDPLTEEDELVEQVLYYLLGQNGAI